MSKKILFKNVKAVIESEDGYTLLSTEYRGCKSKLQIKCANDHLFEMTYDNFKQGKRCYECKMTKWNIDKAKKLFEEKGLILLEEKYVNNTAKMKYQCQKHIGVTQEIALSNVQQGNGCKICGIERVSEIKRNDITMVIKKLEENNFKLFNPEKYKNNNTQLVFECANGHKFTNSYANVIKSKGCKKCKGIVSENEENVMAFVKNRGYKLLSFTDRDSNILVECPNRHTTNISWRSFRNGQECTSCTGFTKTKYDYEMVKEIFKNSNMTLISDTYKNSTSPMKFCCSKGHIGEMTLNTVLKGSGCWDCGKIKASISRTKTFYENGTQKASRQQRYIHKVLGGELNFPIGFYSLDVAFPNQKIYIEYDGGGHDLSVKIGQITQEEFKRKSLIRSVSLSKKGWHEIRIICHRDYVPNKDKLKKMMKDAINLFNQDRSWVKFNIDENKLITSKYEINYDFGELKDIKGGEKNG